MFTRVRERSQEAEIGEWQGRVWRIKRQQLQPELRNGLGETMWYELSADQRRKCDEELRSSDETGRGSLEKGTCCGIPAGARYEHHTNIISTNRRSQPQTCSFADTNASARCRE